MKKSFILLYLTISIVMYAPTSKEQILDLELRKTSLLILSNIELDEFLYALQLQETWDTIFRPQKGSALSCVNEIGAMGLWQTMPKTLRGLGYKGSFKKFLHSKNLQQEYIIKLLKTNKIYLDVYIPNWKDLIDKEIRGITITASGLLAACHFAGVGGLKKFLRTGYNAFDGNSYITHYLKKFQGYEFGLTI